MSAPSTPTAPSGEPTPEGIGARDPHPPGEPLSPQDRVLRRLLAAAGRVALSFFGEVETSRKADGSLVTEADRQSERVLVEGLLAAFPEDGLSAEEGSRETGSGPGRWVIDPIDGTGAFVEGLAHWGPTVARIEDGRVRCAAAWMPRLSEYYFFQEGLGGFRNGLRLPPLPDQPQGRGRVAYIPSRLHAVLRLDWPGKARCLGSHMAHLCLIAAGSAEVALVGPGWKPWDTAAGLALIEAAGGRACRLADGAPLDLVRDAGAPFVAGTAAAVAWLLEPGRIGPLPPRPAIQSGLRGSDG